jgi:hypothetical protein
MAQAVGFLTKVGQTCTPAHQEFILLLPRSGRSSTNNLNVIGSNPIPATD